MRTGKTAIALTLVIAAAGCRHYAGWVDHEVRTTRLREQAPLKQVSAGAALRVRPPTASSGWIEVRAFRTYTVRQPVKRELLARRTYVPYHWSTPLVKPIVGVTVFLPFYFAYTNPHNHGGDTWGKMDYLRDVVGYFNAFEAYISGPQHVEEEWSVLWSERGHELLPDEKEPLDGAQLEIWLDDKRLGAANSDASGVARFDLRPHVTPALAKSSRQVTVAVVQGDARLAQETITLDQKVLRSLLPEP